MMAKKQVTLRSFAPDELVLDEEETKTVLKFFFPADSTKIDNLTINNRVRNFAQGLLVEAIDATYAMGFVQALWESFSNPAKLTKGLDKALIKFAKKASKHWFKHATETDLMNVKIYETVRITISRNFRTFLYIDFLTKKETNDRFVAMLDYNTISLA
jgi:hypothetical protein